MIRTYCISRDGLRTLLWRSGRLSFAVTVLLIAIAMRMRMGEESSQRASGWLLVYLFVVLAAGTWLTTRSTRRIWTSYRLELSSEGLRRTQYRLPEIAIDRPEVTNIEEIPGRGLVVRTANPEVFIFVPAGLNDYAEVRSALTQWAPLTALSMRSTWWRQWMGITVALLMVVWMVATREPEEWCDP
jgi:hypothetical protein